MGFQEAEWPTPILKTCRETLLQLQANETDTSFPFLRTASQLPRN